MEHLRINALSSTVTAELLKGMTGLTSLQVTDGGVLEPSALTSLPDPGCLRQLVLEGCASCTQIC